jgi:Alkylmercury lyase
MLLFRSEEHIEAWYRRRGIATGATLTLDQAWELARIWYADRMAPDWERRTPEEAEAVFASVGLTGEFWRLTGP